MVPYAEASLYKLVTFMLIGNIGGQNGVSNGNQNTGDENGNQNGNTNDGNQNGLGNGNFNGDSKNGNLNGNGKQVNIKVKLSAIQDVC